MFYRICEFYVRMCLYVYINIFIHHQILKYKTHNIIVSIKGKERESRRERDSGEREIGRQSDLKKKNAQEEHKDGGSFFMPPYLHKMNRVYAKFIGLSSSERAGICLEFGTITTLH